MTHDPSEYIRGIYQILINNKKRIGFLFGAGTSLAKKDKDKSLSVPAIKELTEIIVKNLLGEKDGQKKAIYEEITNALKEDLGENFNVEKILSNLEQMHSIIGKKNFNGLDKEGYRKLILNIKNQIRKIASVHLTNPIDFDSIVQSDFAMWIGQADRAFGVEIFTTNYDFLFELGLEYNGIPYYDGFTGSFKPFFNSDSVEKLNYLPFQTKLWKIHGSIGWHVDEKTNTVIRDNSDAEDIIIYPSIFKYQDSRKLPYISLLDRLSNFLREDDSVLFTCGYSFNDMHINERILSALNTDKNSHVIALYWDEINEKDKKESRYSLNKESTLFKLASSTGKISVLGFRSAVIGRQIGVWKLHKEPDKNETPKLNLYFDEDAAINEGAEKNIELKGNEKYTGEGRFLLPDFIHFVKFLNSMIQENSLIKAISNGNK